MKIPKETVRLSMIVKACGRPEPLTLWSKPSQNQKLRAAIEQQRVLTVLQSLVGTKKDFGMIGFLREKNAAYWVFPKPLTPFARKKVIGIDYGLLQIPPAKSPGRLGAPKSRPPAQATPRPPREPKIFAFDVTVRCTAIVDVVQTVAAANRPEARQLALAALARKKVDFSKGTQARQPVRAERVRNDDSGPSARFRRSGRL